MKDEHPVLGGCGRLQAVMPGFELRPQQITMAAAVESAIVGATDLMVEAGTGVGKTFAYLVPLLDERSKIERAVISTGTIALQEQLIGKDLPFLASVLGGGQRHFAILKGRSNYVCPRRLDLADSLQGELFDSTDERRILGEVAREVEQALSRGATRGLTLQELESAPPPEIWRTIRAEEGSCAGALCHRRSGCPFRDARVDAQSADLLVVNHALLIADLALRCCGENPVLPDFDVLVLDEAHRLEDVAASGLGDQVRSGAVLGYLKFLSPSRRGGWLESLGAGAMTKEVRHVYPEVTAFFDELRSFLSGRGETSMQLSSRDCILDTLSEPLLQLAATARSEAGTAGTDESRVELLAIAERIEKQGMTARRILGLEQEGHVVWGERELKGRGAALCSSPIDVASTLREHLFDPRRSAILTSATLFVPGPSPSRHFRERLGLDGGNDLLLGSPFSYRQRVELIVAGTLPDPSRKAEYLEALAPAVMRYLAGNDGGAFVLFSSYEALNRAYRDCATELEALGYTVLRQGGELAIPGMLERFREAERGVIFGADSFWEGIDVPGRALSLVIITRLPFSTPGHPLTKGRLDAIRCRGGNPFRELSLPKAILRFKQGFGRLIRSADDAGRVVVLDPRITGKWYGRQFLEALPKCRVTIEG